MKINRIILASKSPRRQEILKLMGYDPIILVGSFDESSVNEINPEKYVIEISKGKTESVKSSAEKGDLVITADTIVVSEDKILGKPKNRSDAKTMLMSLSGKTHQVFTGVTLYLYDGIEERRVSFCEKTDVFVDEISEDEIEKYIDTGEPMDKAGAYGIQGCFCKYISNISGDYYNVMGLPAAALYKKIKQLASL